MISAGRLSRRFPLLAPVAAALLIRLVAWCGAEWALQARQTEFLIAGDAGGYVELAWDLSAGNPYTIGDDFPRRAMRPPLFPLVLAGPVAADLHLLPGRSDGYLGWRLSRLAVVLCGALAVWATGRLGTAIAGPRVGAAAAWLAAVNPLAIAFGVMLLSESLFALLATISLWGVAECVRADDDRAKPSPRWQPAVWSGLAAAGATLTRPVWLLMPFAVAALALWLRFRAGKPGAWGGILLLAFGVGYAPWPLRNFVVLGELVLTTTWAGPTLYDSLGPQATGASDMRFFEPDERVISEERGPEPTFYVPPPDRAQYVRRMREVRGAVQAAWADRPTGVGPMTKSEAAVTLEAMGAVNAAWFQARGLDLNYGFDEVAVDRNYRRAALDAAFADPGRVARLAVVKQGRFWRPWPVGGLPGGVVGGVLKAGFAAYFLPLVGLAVWGGVVMWRDREPEARASGVNEDDSTHGRSSRFGLTRVWPLVLTWGPVLGFAAVCLVFVGSVRYRLPGEFPLAAAAGVGLLELWDRRRDSTPPAAHTGD